MRETIEQPEALVDVTALSARSRKARDGGLIIGAAANNTAVAADRRGARRAIPMLARAILAGASGADPQHGDGRRQHPAAHALLPTSMTTAARCNKRAPGAGCDAIDGLQSHPRHPRRLAGTASPPIRPTCASRWPRSMRSSISRTARRAQHPVGRPPPPARRHARTSKRLEPGELITAIDLPPLALRGALDLSQGARPGELRLRAGLGRRGARACRRRQQFATSGWRSAASRTSRGAPSTAEAALRGEPADRGDLPARGRGRARRRRAASRQRVSRSSWPSDDRRRARRAGREMLA